jgi:hypothetical protein
MTPHPPSYLGHPLPRGEGDSAKRDSRVRGFSWVILETVSPMNQRLIPSVKKTTPDPSPPWGRG